MNMKPVKDLKELQTGHKHNDCRGKNVTGPAIYSAKYIDKV